MKHLFTLLFLVPVFCLTPNLTSFAGTFPPWQKVSSPVADTCPSTIFNYTLSSSTSAVVSNASPTATLMPICNGGYIVVGMLTADVPTANFRFIEQLNSNGNVLFEGIPLPTQRAPINHGIDYFRRTYGTYALINPNLTGTISVTLTPYIDLNNDRQFNPETECLGQPAYINYTVTTTPPPNITATYTLKPGNWNDASVWSCGHIPQISDLAQIKYVVTLPPNYQAGAMQLTVDANQRLLFGTSSTIRLGATSIQGLFTGTYTYDNNPELGAQYFSFEIRPDGTLIVNSENYGQPYRATGTWALNGTAFTGSYTYESGFSPGETTSQSVTANWDAAAGKLTAGVWQNTSPANGYTGAFTLSKAN